MCKLGRIPRKTNYKEKHYTKDVKCKNEIVSCKSRWFLVI